MSTALVSNFYDFGDSVYKQNMPSTHNLQFSESSYHQPLPLSRRNSNPVSSNINVNLNTQVNNTPTATAKLTCLENVNNLATQLSSHRKLDRSYSEPVDKKNAPNNNQQPNPNSSRYKTELCRPFEENGHCKYGEKCQFAHGYQELRTLSRHPKYKTELCRTFHTIGFCPYGPRCHFIHNADEARKPPPSSPTNPTIIPRELQQRPSTIPIMTPSLGSTAESPSPHSSMSGSPNSMSFLEEVYNKPFSPSPITPTTSSAFSFPEFSAPHSPPLVSLKSSVPYSQSYNSVQALNHRNELESLLREASPLLGALETPPSPVDSLASDLDTLSISGASEIHSNTPAGPISSSTHGLRLPIFNIISGQ